MSERPPGFEEYTPSRLEWFMVVLNSYMPYINTLPGEHPTYLFTLGGDENTITMHMRYYADMSPEAVKRLEDTGKDFAIHLAERYKWDSWINIQTKFDPIDREAPKA